MTQPATYIAVIVNPNGHNRPEHRLKKTFQVGKVDGIYKLPLATKSTSPVGTTAQQVLHSLGHPDMELPSLSTLAPHNVRQLRDVAHRSRKTGGRVHIIGVLDNDSPFGQRRMIEQMVRFFKGSHIPVVLHLGVWHATPNEFNYGLREIRSICNDLVSIGSIFSLDPSNRQFQTKDYLDKLAGEMQPDSWQDVRYPLPKGYVFHGPAINTKDSFVIANHSLHGLDNVCEVLQDWSDHPVVSMLCGHQAHPDVHKSLNKYRHIVSVASRPSYQEAYWGNELGHPYFESVRHPSPTTLLELLNSPHFGYVVQPYRTVVLLDEDLNRDFDWLLSSYLKSQRNRSYYCAVIDPTSLEGYSLLTNMSLDPLTLQMSHLHQYA